ncbi:MAG: hypothetical protein LLG01_08135 [Planctomycetaceae bacterium]|nr:hypothetical protein [Planctomycetaceae bacterium]
MKTIGMIVILGTLCATSIMAADPAAPGQLGNVAPWSQKDFVNPPLKCMERYLRFDVFPIVGWCFHGDRQRDPKRRQPYDESYCEQAKAAGFTVLVDDDRMLEPCRKTNMRLIIPTFRVTPDHLEDRFFKKADVGDHPALLGFVMDDDCMGVTGQVIRTAAWLKGTHPHLAAFVSKYPTRDPQTNTECRILATMNYQFMKGKGGAWSRIRYYAEMEHERNVCNKGNLAMWPIIFGHTYSEHRFSITAGLAYGAQGFIYFAYLPHKLQWMIPERLDFHKNSGDIQTYAWKVIGRHLWGTRSLGVYQTDYEGDTHGSALKCGPDQVVREMDQALLAGMLVVESRMPAAGQKVTPDYIMVGDKRAARRGDDPPLRKTWIALGGEIPVVEILDRDAMDPKAPRKFCPGRYVPIELKGGDGVLLRANPADVEKVLGAEAAKALTELAAELNKISAGDAKACDAAKGAADKLKAALDAAVKDKKVSAAQADAVMKCVAAAIEGLRTPPPPPPAPPAAAPAPQPKKQG